MLCILTVMFICSFRYSIFINSNVICSDYELMMLASYEPR
jgi:hypothetical protein